MRIALAQINPTVGDFAGNRDRILRFAEQAHRAAADLVVFPELSVPGYPPRDLVDLQEFVQAGEAVIRDLAARLRDGPAAVIGFVQAHSERGGLGRFNAAAWLENGECRAVAHKRLLPNYDVFDERRYFDPGRQCLCVPFGGLRFGVTICEDLWNDKLFWERRLYPEDPLEQLATTGCDWVLNLSSSPYHVGKPQFRRQMLAAASRHHSLGILYCNMVGGNDALVFDGNSMALAPGGALLDSAPAFEEHLLVVDLDQAPAVNATSSESTATEKQEEEVYQALVLGVRDYAHKLGFQKAVVGLSGGIDSSLTVAIAAQALGPENVFGVAMPSRFTSSMSDEDARSLAENLGIRFEVVPIEAIVAQYRQGLEGVLGTGSWGLTGENLQARARGMILMAISNKLGHLVLSTGNKSELAVGYCTLYGDMAGGLAVIGDLPKTLVYQLSQFVNRKQLLIPERILSRPPTAELRDDQKDEDSLPPYDELDPLLHDMVVERLSTSELCAKGHLPERIREVRRLLIGAEYKRRQAAPTLRVSPRAFGEGWRFPIAHRFRAASDDFLPGPEGAAE